jgi:acetylornithine deacetylase
MRPVRAHKGMMMDSIKLTGRSGHSSDPALGNSALDAMHSVISELMKFRNEMKQKYHNESFEIPYPTLNLGSIHGGDSPNRICGQCDLQIDVRPLPGMHLDTIRAEIAQRVKAVTDPLEIDFELVTLFPGTPAFLAEKNSQLLATAEKLTGHSGITVAFGTEGPLLQKLGMDTIILGPGNIDQAHQPDEYMSLDMIAPCIDFLQKMIHQHCLQ